MALTREQVRRVDRIAVEEYGISGLVLMENAGRNAARIILQELDLSPGEPTRAVIFCGTGNNGGDGFVIARHLANAGADVRIGLAGDPQRLSPDAAANQRICQAMKLPIQPAHEVAISENDLVVDALLGTGFTGDVRKEIAGLISDINTAAKRHVVAVDVPSGLDCDTGAPSNATVIADTTITFVADKVGFRNVEAQPFVGTVHVCDIGAPREITERVRK